MIARFVVAADGKAEWWHCGFGVEALNVTR